MSGNNKGGGNSASVIAMIGTACVTIAWINSCIDFSAHATENTDAPPSAESAPAPAKPAQDVRKLSL